MHLTEAVDTRYTRLDSDFGKEGAKHVAQSSHAAIERSPSLRSLVPSPEIRPGEGKTVRVRGGERLAVYRDAQEIRTRSRASAPTSAAS